MNEKNIFVRSYFLNSICFAQTNFQLNKKIETGATIKKIEQSAYALKIQIYMKNKRQKNIHWMKRIL